jgi:hypothetical protein
VYSAHLYALPAACSGAIHVLGFCGVSGPTHALLIERDPESLEAAKAIFEAAGLGVQRGTGSQKGATDLVLVEGGEVYDFDFPTLSPNAKVVVWADSDVGAVNKPNAPVSGVMHGSLTQELLRSAVGLEAPTVRELSDAELASLREATLLAHVTPRDSATDLCTDLVQIFGARQSELLTIAGKCWTDSSTNLSTAKTQELQIQMNLSGRFAAPLYSSGSKGVQTTISVPLVHDHKVIGYLGLTFQAAVVLSERSAVAFQAAGMRLGRELAWCQARAALEAELEDVRDSDGLDPLLQIWSNSTMARIAKIMLAGAKRTSYQTMAAVIDVRGMGAINERHGRAEGDRLLQILKQI